MKHMRRGLLLLVFCSMPACWAAKTSPVLESVTNNCDGTCTAVFGYNHSGSKVEKIPVGAENRFVGSDSQNVGQPVSFERGRHRSVVTARFGGDRLMWVLEGDSAVALADSADNSCLWTVPKGAWEAIARDLASFRSSAKRIFPGIDTAKATIGQPFRIFVSMPRDRESFMIGDPVSRMVDMSTNAWLFPLWYRNEVVGIDVLKFEDGRWRGSNDAYGLVYFELGYLRENWPDADGYHPYIVTYATNDAQPVFCFSLPELGRRNLTRFTPEPMPDTLRLPWPSTVNVKTKYKSISSLDETMSTLTK